MNWEAARQIDHQLLPFINADSEAESQAALEELICNQAQPLIITHLTYEQQAALVDEQIDDIDREILESHLELCPPCETEFNDLREIRSTMEARGRKIREQAPAHKSSRQERFTSFRLPAFSLLTVAALVAVALLCFLISIPLRRENPEARARVAELERLNAELREQNAAVDSLQNELAGLRQENERLRQAAGGQTLVALNDGSGRIILDTQGNLSGTLGPKRSDIRCS